MFVRGGECHFACTHCDLWKHTHDEPTVPGAIVEQLAGAISEARDRDSRSIWGIKLYNASSWFQSSAVPQSDGEQICELVAEFEQVVVEAHPLLVGTRCLEMGERLQGRLQVALGLETADASVLAKLNKRFDLSDYERACRTLRGAGLSIRTFLLIGLPHLPESRQAASVERSVAYSALHGADVISLIPLRPGNGALEDLSSRGLWNAPDLTLVEQVLDTVVTSTSAGGSAEREECDVPGRAAAYVVQVDPWDLEQLSECPDCDPSRRERLVAMSLDQQWRPPVDCERCGRGNGRSR